MDGLLWVVAGIGVVCVALMLLEEIVEKVFGEREDS